MDGRGPHLAVHLPGVEVIGGEGVQVVAPGELVEVGELLRGLFLGVGRREQLPGCDDQLAADPEDAHGGGVDAVALQLQVGVGVPRLGGIGGRAGVVAVEQGGDPGDVLAFQRGAGQLGQAAQYGEVHGGPCQLPGVSPCSGGYDDTRTRVRFKTLAPALARAR